MTSFAAAIDKTARAKSDKTTERLRDEYLDTLVANPLIGTTRGGAVTQFGFPSAIDLLGPSLAIDSRGESKASTFALPKQEKPAGELVAVNTGVEFFTAFLEEISKRERIVA